MTTGGRHRDKHSKEIVAMCAKGNKSTLPFLWPADNGLAIIV